MHFTQHFYPFTFNPLQKSQFKSNTIYELGKYKIVNPRLLFY